MRAKRLGSLGLLEERQSAEHSSGASASAAFDQGVAGTSEFHKRGTHVILEASKSRCDAADWTDGLDRESRFRSL